MARKKGVSRKEAGRVEEIEVQNPLAEDIEDRMRGALDDVEDITPDDVAAVGLNPKDYEFEAATEGEAEAPEEGEEPVAEEPAAEPVLPEVPSAAPEPDMAALQAQIAELQGQVARSKEEFGGLLEDKKAAINRAQQAEYLYQLEMRRAATAPQAAEPAEELPADDEFLTRAQARQIVMAERQGFARSQAERDNQQFVGQHPDFAEDVRTHLVPYANARPDKMAFLQALNQLPLAYAHEHVQQIKRASLAEARVRELEGGKTATGQPAPPVAPPIIPAGRGGLGRTGQLTDKHAIADLMKRLSRDQLTPEDEELLEHSEQVDPMTI